MWIVVLLIVCFYLYKWSYIAKRKELAAVESRDKMLRQLYPERYAPQVPVKEEVPLTYEERVDINRQIDEFLGAVKIELPVRMKKLYRPRPDLLWFDTNWGATLQPSGAEQKIIDELEKYDIKWVREISFAGLKLSTGGWGRFDFYLPEHNTIIEYNSRLHHLRPERAEVDVIKEAFCKEKDINLIVWNHLDYYYIPARVKELMDTLEIV